MKEKTRGDFDRWLSLLLRDILRPGCWTIGSLCCGLLQNGDCESNLFHYAAVCRPHAKVERERGDPFQTRTNAAKTTFICSSLLPPLPIFTLYATFDYPHPSTSHTHIHTHTHTHRGNQEGSRNSNILSPPQQTCKRHAKPHSQARL